MKTKLLFFIFFVFIFFNINTYWYIKPDMKLTWITDLIEDTTKWNWWKIVFPDTNWVLINVWNLESDSTLDISISWNFWLENNSSSSNLDYWWATFDIWTVFWASKVILTNNLDNNFTFNWYAWSKVAWWIYFWDTWIVDWKVVYNRNTWKVDWCAWSQNLWWLCIDNFELDTTPPDLSSLDTLFITNHAKNITFTDSDIATIEVENWDSIAKSIYNNTLSFTHDFRKAKSYEIKVTDTSWNYSTGTIQVVAWTPSIILTDWWIWLNASEFSSTIIWEKKANWLDKYELRFSLRDTYWNTIINETWIKEVEVELWFDNTVDKDQIDNFDFWGAIIYSNNNFWLFSWFINSWTWYTTDWDYSIDISSLAPTKQWYDFTSDNNDIKINKLDIKVTVLNSNSWVWEWIFNTFYSNINKNFEFTPSVYIEDDFSNSDNWNLIRDLETTFIGTISIDSPNNITNLKVAHLFDTIVPYSGIGANTFISLQNLEVNTWALNFDWYGYVKPNNTNTNYTYNCIDSWCAYNLIPYSSNLIYKYNWPYNLSSISFTNNIKTIPRLVVPWISEYDIKYNSVIEYDTDWIIIKYPSYSYSTGNTVTNNQIKITWIVTENVFSVIDDSSINKVWNLSKAEVFRNIKKNIAPYQKIWTWVWGVYYTNTDYEISSWPSWIDTIIVDWWDLIISGDIEKSWNQINSIVVLKWDTVDKWNIWITEDIQRIEAVIVTDKSILSWDGTNIYPDNSAKDQLFIKWSIISYNTIWWASLSIPKCPYYIQTCDLDTAKKYDLNNMRYFIDIIQWSPVPNLPNTDWYDTASMVIEYDSLLQVNIPKIFLLNY